MKMMFLAMTLVVTLGCGGRQNGKGASQVETKAAEVDRVEVIYFHGKQRCTTCQSIEQGTREVMAENFGEDMKTGKVVFRVVDISEKEGEEVADRYEVTWSSLFVNRWKDGKEQRNNMTEFAFEKAVSDAEGFKEGVKTKIEELRKGY